MPFVFPPSLSIDQNFVPSTDGSLAHVLKGRAENGENRLGVDAVVVCLEHLRLGMLLDVIKEHVSGVADEKR